jgi:hypothetical protein
VFASERFWKADELFEFRHLPSCSFFSSTSFFILFYRCECLQYR